MARPAIPPIWMEPRCDAQLDLDPLSPNACMQTGSGVFACTASVAYREFTRAGWRVVDERWCCPVCYKALQLGAGA